MEATDRHEPISTPGFVGKLLSVDRPATAKTVLLVFAVGLLFDQALRVSDIGVLTTILFSTAAVALVVAAWPTRSRWLVICAASVPVFAVWLSVRTSPWLLPFDVLATSLLLCSAASFGKGGSPFSLTVPSVVVRSALAVAQFVLTVPFVTKPFVKLLSRGRVGNVVPIIRGVLLIAPAFLVVLALLVSSDAVFASFFDFNLSIGDAVGHIVLIIIGGWLFATLVRISVSAAAPDDPPTYVRIGATEGLIAIGSFTALFAAFVASQVVVWAGGADRVLKTAGLTYAEHAREGFFQLLAVAVITLFVLMATRATTALSSDKHRVWFRVLSIAAIALTLAIVAVAVRRLALYEDAYGLTMLRLYSTIFAFLIAGVFVLLGISMVKSHNSNWFVGASATLALVVLLVLNIVNPEAFVVNRNVDRQLAGQGAPFDPYYVSGLSDDSIPALIGSLDNVSEQERTTIVMRLCSMPNARSTKWTSWNWSGARAADLLEQQCVTH